jgi:putative ATP-dependent endonuclease of OLD family
MRLSHVKIEGFRCLNSVEVPVGDLSILLGGNNAGKSSFLRALDFFFNGAPLEQDDVFGGEDRAISVEVTFTDLTPADREAFTIYAQGDQMVLRRSWRDGQEKITGRSRRFPGFSEIREASGNSRRRVYREFREANTDMGLEEATTKEAIEQQLLTWEMQHPDRCDKVDDEAGHLLGYRSVGEKRLSDRYKFVLVPAVRDAASEAVERKGTILQQLLTAIAEQRAEADEKLVDLQEDMRSRYAKVVDESHGPTLNGLGDQLSAQMRRYIPTADVIIEPQTPDLSIAPPQVSLRAGEERHVTDLGRQGHGFQRTFIIAALEYLAGQAPAEDDSDRPMLHLALEEPELYQHPPRARHFSSTLHALATLTSVQVSYATHSPYFVAAGDLSGIRLFRQVLSDEKDDSPMQTEVVVSDLDKVNKYVPGQKELARYVARTLDVRLGEALFARAVLLVEGATDAAVLSQAARIRGSDLSANGIVVAAPGKSSIPIAAAVLDSLDIPYYVVFDADGDAEDKEACSKCGRGKHERRDGVAKENQRIFDALGVQEVDFPSTGTRDVFACFATNLEGFLSEEIEDFQDLIQAVASEMQWKAKSPEVYAEVIERNGSDDLPYLLGEVIDKVMSRAKYRLALNP